MSIGEVMKRLSNCKSRQDLQVLKKHLIEKQILDCGGLYDEMEDMVWGSLKLMATRLNDLHLIRLMEDGP